MKFDRKAIKVGDVLVSEANDHEFVILSVIPESPKVVAENKLREASGRPKVESAIKVTAKLRSKDVKFRPQTILLHDGCQYFIRRNDPVAA